MSNRMYSRKELEGMIKMVNEGIKQGKEFPFYDTMDKDHQKKGGKVIKMWLDDKDRVKAECELNGKRVIADATPG